jgi:hypothetical protein
MGRLEGSMSEFELLADGGVHAVAASADGARIRVDPASLAQATGWSLRPEGLCRGDVCVPVRDPAALDSGGRIDLEAFAAALGRPLALDAEAGAAALGVAAGERATQLSTLEAPDFELPDLEGKLHRLSEHRGKKVLLIAYASW